MSSERVCIGSYTAADSYRSIHVAELVSQNSNRVNYRPTTIWTMDVANLGMVIQMIIVRFICYTTFKAFINILLQKRSNHM